MGTCAKLEVVEADDGEIVGHTDVAPLALEQRAEGKVVIAAEKRFDARSSQHLGEELAAERDGRSAWGGGHGAVVVDAGLCHRLDVTFHPPPRARIEARGDVADPAVAEVEEIARGGITGAVLRQADIDVDRIVGELHRLDDGDTGLLEEEPGALALIDALEARGGLEGYAWMPAVRADLLRRLGRREAAREAYLAATAATQLEPLRRLYARRLAELDGSGKV